MPLIINIAHHLCISNVIDNVMGFFSSPSVVNFILPLMPGMKFLGSVRHRVSSVVPRL
jgi:hypothetical protein